MTVNESSSNLSLITTLGATFFINADGESTSASPQAAVVGDFDRDGDLDLVVPTLTGQQIDLFLNTANSGPACAPDLDGDGVVGAADLAGLLAAWGACP